MAYLVSNEVHRPVAVFDVLEYAIEYVCSWSKTSKNQVHLKPIGSSSDMVEVRSEQGALGYIMKDIKYNPNYNS
jgi:hypothetical protein